MDPVRDRGHIFKTMIFMKKSKFNTTIVQKTQAVSVSYL